MKTSTKISLIISFLAISFSSLAQAPEGINYQATVRNSSGALMTSQSVAVIFSIRQTSAIGTIIYQETHSVTTNNYGGFTAIIGGGAATSGTFNSINWSSNSYYLNVTVNGNDLGTTQLISVPYALYAKTSGSSTPGPAGATGAQGATGLQGPIGNTGPTGTNGTNGAMGPQGSVGNIGATGPQGPVASDDQDIDSITLNGNTLTVYINNGNSASVSLDSISSSFKNQNGTIRQKGDYDTTNFLFGSPQMDDDGDTLHGKRMFFNKEKGAFRVGASNSYYVFGIRTSNNWDYDSLGYYSFASGFGTKAIGNQSTATGSYTKAIGENSTAMGSHTKAIGNYSTTIGSASRAIGNYSTAMGRITIASGDFSTAMGYSTNATGYSSFAVGHYTNAIGGWSTSIGRGTNAIGRSSTAMGAYTIANVNYSTAIGRYNDTTTYGLLFSIGNGSSSSNRLNSMHISQSTNNAYFRGHVSPTLHNTVSLGRPSNRWSTLYATNGTIQTSDTTLKTNIQPLSYGLTDLMKIQTITYAWKDDKYGVKKIGFNAQNLLKIIPEVVQTHSAHTDEGTGEVTYKKNGKLGVYYSDMIPVLTKSIQEQQEIIKKQEAENQEQNVKNEKQTKELEVLKKELEEQRKNIQELKKTLQQLLERKEGK
jgi:hypothetical protein